MSHVLLQLVVCPSNETHISRPCPGQCVLVVVAEHLEAPRSDRLCVWKSTRNSFCDDELRFQGARHQEVRGFHSFRVVGYESGTLNTTFQNNLDNLTGTRVCRKVVSRLTTGHAA
jgi:hypothetical protein